MSSPSNHARGGAVSPLVHGSLLIALVAAGATLGPALAYSKAPADASFTAVDYAWRANGTDATTLTIAPGGTVAFGYPAGASFHNVVFADPKPSCGGLPPGPRPKGWHGECTFVEPGTYAFVCGAHAEMTGKVVVEAASTPIPTPTPTATADPAATPEATATPTPILDTKTRAQTALTVKLAPKQHGTRVRGTVDVRDAHSRLEVTVTARLKKAVVRVGHWVKPSTPSGAVAFSVPLDVTARRALRGKRRLAVTVTAGLTPPGGRKLVHSAKATIRPR